MPFSFIPCSRIDERRRSPGRRPRACARSRSASPARSRSRGCSAIATTCRRERLSCHVHRRLAAGPLDRRHPDQDRERADRRRVAASTRSTTCKRAPARTRSRSCWRSWCWRSTSATGTANAQAVWLFPQLLDITKRWLAECLTCKDNTFPQTAAAGRVRARRRRPIYQRDRRARRKAKHASSRSCAHTTRVGSTRYVDFDTTKPVYATRADKCHVSHVVADTGSWEQKMAQVLEEMDEVDALRQEPGPRLHDPLHAQRRAAAVLSPTSSRRCRGRTC